LQRRHGSKKLADAMAVRPGRHELALLAALLIGGGGACETLNFRLNPFAGTEVRVTSVERVGPYLFAAVHGSQVDLSFAVPATETCTRVLEPGAELRYEKSGNFGLFRRNDEACSAVGTLSLAEWRDRQPRRRANESVIPRSTARYAVAYRDARFVLLRGRFALASRVGVPAGFDVVAVVPADESCAGVVASGQASLEFRPAGRDPFRLLSGRTPCVVQGFALPVEGLPGAGSAAQ
jgi:hypothetical protein